MASNLSKTQTTISVRRALIRHWIDLDRLMIVPVRGTVRVSGELRSQRREVTIEGLTSLLSILEEEIRRCVGVERVLFDLENWTKDDLGNWIPLRR